MNKKCPHCSYTLSRDRREFILQKVGDWMLCNMCNRKIYMVIPEKKRSLMMLLYGLIFIAFMVCLCVGVFFVSIFGLGSMEAFPVFILSLIFMFAGVYPLVLYFFRVIHWNLSIAQKSPFV